MKTQAVSMGWGANATSCVALRQLRLRSPPGAHVPDLIIRLICLGISLPACPQLRYCCIGDGSRNRMAGEIWPLQGILLRTTLHRTPMSSLDTAKRIADFSASARFSAMPRSACT